MSYEWFVKLLWLASAFFDYTEFTYLWQKGDYGVRKIRHFLASREGRSFWMQYHVLWRAFFSLALFISPLNTPIIVWYLLTIIFISDIIYSLYKILNHNFNWPNFTPKSATVILFSIILESIALLSIMMWQFVFLFIALRFFIIGLSVTILKLPTRWIKKVIIYRAAKKIRNCKKLIIIGIVGSYGKSTTKEFLSHILKNKYSVDAVPSKIRTDIAVARYILMNDFSNTQVLIVEMSGARPGYLSSLSKMLKPNIVILTGINSQHISYFGSEQKIVTDKYAAFADMQSDGLAIINADKYFCPECIKQIPCPVYLYGLDEEHRPNFLINDTKRSIDQISFQAVVEGKLLVFTAPISGEHNALNIAACYATARHLGIPEVDIVESVKSLHLPKGVHDKYISGDTIIIDDSENSNSEGFKSALFVLGAYPSDYRKVVITHGMTELGETAARAHHNIGEEISLIADQLIVISRDYFETMRQGVGNRSSTTVSLIEDEADLLSFLKSITGSKTVILIENSVPRKIKEFYRNSFNRI